MSSINAQNIQTAKFTIDTLSSPSFKGRGASGHGDSLASIWLQNQFNKLGLKKIEESYFQKFSYPINTYTQTLSLSFGKTKLQCGKDYILRPESQSIKGKFKLLKLDTLSILKTIKQKKNTKTALIIDGIWWNKLKKNQVKSEIVDAFPLILFTQKSKLTASLSTSQEPYTHIDILDSTISLQKSKYLYLDIKCFFEKSHLSNNVLGYVEGTQIPDSFLIISAHYDHLGLMGSNVYFPGANDNASGISMLLELAQYYKTNPHKYSIIFIAFSAEEAGLIGSKYFVKNSPINLKKIKFVVNLDMVGTGEAGIAIVNATIFEKEFAIIDSINQKNQYFKYIKKRGKAANSDHYPFSEANVPAFFLYTMGGIQAYHDINDISKTLPLSHYKQVFEIVHQFLDMF